MHVQNSVAAVLEQAWRDAESVGFFVSRNLVFIVGIGEKGGIDERIL